MKTFWWAPPEDKHLDFLQTPNYSRLMKLLSNSNLEEQRHRCCTIQSARKFNSLQKCKCHESLFCIKGNVQKKIRESLIHFGPNQGVKHVLGVLKLIMILNGFWKITLCGIKGVCLFVHFLKLEVSLLQDFERHRYVTLSWIEGNTETCCQYPQKISPQAATYFVKSKSWPKDTSTGSENSVDLVLFGSDSEKHYLPKFDSEMRTSFTYEWFFYEIKENWDQSVHRRHSNVWSGCFCSTHETVDFVRDYSFQQTSHFLPFRTEGDSVIIPTSVQHVQVFYMDG